MKGVEYREEDGSIVLDAETELYKRADTGFDKEYTLSGDRKQLGSKKTDIDEQIAEDKQKSGWDEELKPGEVKHTCPVCGTIFTGKKNQKYCSPRCSKTMRMRRYRKAKRDIKNFKPHTGTVGEIYYITEVNGKDVISFVPAFYAETRLKATKYINERYEGKQADDIIQQVNEVIPK